MRYIFRVWFCVLLLACAATGPPSHAQEQQRGLYVVEEGDTLYRIARTHDLSVRALRRLNDGLEGDAIYPGQELRVRPAGSSASTDTARAPAGRQTDVAASFYGSHTVEAGDTFYTIAPRYGVAVDSLVALNDSARLFLETGAQVRLPAAVGPPSHTVAAGETIYDVARRYNVSARLLQYANDLEEKSVVEGQRLRLPGREAPAPEPPGTRPPVRATGPVARYPASYEGRLMAGGARYAPDRFTVSHPTLPLGTVVLLSNPASERQTFAEVTDRGPLDEDLLMDVSAAVYRRLGLDGEARSPVEVRVMD